jgi:hypothetical protein
MSEKGQIIFDGYHPGLSLIIALNIINAYICFSSTMITLTIKAKSYRTVFVVLYGRRYQL